jgi:Uma2 family endonuclease
VKEYWILDPEEQSVQVHVLKEGRYDTTIYGIYNPDDPIKGIPDPARYVSDIVPVTVLPGFSIDLKALFA